MQATELSAAQRRILLQIARDTIEEVTGGTPGEHAFADDFASNGAFVTLHRDGALRGCIGTFAPSPSIVATVREMAEAAALRDPRFRPVEHDELERIDLEISLLTPLQPVDDPGAVVEVGRHGLCVARGLRRGVLLPQVASEHGWDAQTFLDQTCLKAGLPVGSWREADAQVEVFEAVVFGEHGEGLR